MRWAVLALWVATETVGATMLRMFLRRGGLHDENLATSYPATLFANFSLGTASIIPWIMFLITGVGVLAWAAFAQFIAVILIGTILALPWHRAQRAGHPTPRGGGKPAFAYPRLVEAGHGLLAWSTAALAVVVALSQ
jgi:hypothetical protein